MPWSTKVQSLEQKLLQRGVRQGLKRDINALVCSMLTSCTYWLKKVIIQTLLQTKSKRQFLSLSIEENKFE